MTVSGTIRGPLVSDRLLGSAGAVSALSAADMLRAAIEGRGLLLPTDLVSRVGGGASTLWKINAAQTLVVSNTSREASIDDAFECGRIAATAALTAVHATAATPLFARLICACPAAATDAARKALVEGVAVAISDAGAVLADAQLIEAPVLRFDVLVAGIVRPDRVRGVEGAQPDDLLILASPLGAGIYAAAHAKRRLSDDDRRVLIAHATRSNRVGITLGTVKNVHAVAGVGPSGLIAATMAVAQAAGLTATLNAAAIPALPRALTLAKSGCVASDSSRNWNRDGARVDLAENVMPEMRALLTDPETSGALLIACKRDSVDRVLKLCRAENGIDAAVIGSLSSQVVQEPRHRVTIVG
ncbi:MAG: selenide, water dikinase SelD [Burkholderiaceae bacterium]